ncbi:MAG: hypothetical protein SGI77_10575 [Pirellulaceae bacterium]|nr:hypothetical protein [Pirellulaceae bacterium]
MILPKGKTQCGYQTKVVASSVARQSRLVHDCTVGVMSDGSDNERSEGLCSPDHERTPCESECGRDKRPLFLLRAVAVVGSGKRFEVISSGELST